MIGEELLLFSAVQKPQQNEAQSFLSPTIYDIFFYGGIFKTTKFGK